jgi:simple sugar transport system ATP-binding protein
LANFLDLHAISKRFGGVHALRDVDMSLQAGEVHCLVGENGSGKSTLVKIIAGVQRPEPGGRIVIEGREYAHLDPVQSTACGIQVIYQDLSLFPNLTVAENIAVGRHLGGLSLVKWGAIHETAQAAMARIDVALDPHARVEDLSIANRQLVAICRAMAADAKLVIMDEPTASLTRHEVDALLRLVADLKKKGICIVFVSHRLDEVLEVAERVTVLRDGAKVGDFEAREMDDKKLAMLMTGKAFAYETGETDFSADEIVLSVKNLTRPGHYKDVSLDIHAGEILGLTGLLGSGRTELARLMFGLDAADSGTLQVQGQVVRFTHPAQAVRLGLAFCPEERKADGIVGELSVRENIVLALQARAGLWPCIRPARQRELAQHYIDLLGIRAADSDMPIALLSGGNQQKALLARWLATSPRVLILDEPTRGIDVAAKQELMNEVMRLARDGMAVLFISSEIDEVLRISDRIVVMRDRRKAGELPRGASEAEVMALICEPTA